MRNFHTYNKYFTLILLQIIVFCLTGCGENVCIEPTDFGFPNVVVPARYNDRSLNTNGDHQISPWLDSGIVLDTTKPLVLTVKNWKYEKTTAGDNNNESNLSAWSSWYAPPNHPNNLLGAYVTRNAPCLYENNDPAQGKIKNIPCLFTKGIGLYGLLAQLPTEGMNPVLYNPNSDGKNMDLPNPNMMNFHVGSLKNTQNCKIYDSAGEQLGCVVYGSEKIARFQNGKLYFKILDNNYQDNSGQYIVTVRSGYAVQDNALDSFAESIITYVLGDDSNQGIISTLYKNVVANPIYKHTVRILLVFYVILAAVTFTLGLVKIQTKVLVEHVMKIVLIGLLISSEYSWTFFYNYLFIFFIKGAQELKYLIQSSVSYMGAGTDLISLIASNTVLTRLKAVILSPGWFLGILYALAFLWAFVKILSITLEFYCIYVAGMFAMGITILLGPVFMCFTLFKITSSLFKNWLKQLIYYTIQPMLLFTGLSLTSIVIASQIYSTLGFKVCNYKFPHFNSISSSFLSWWFPTYDQRGMGAAPQAMISVPNIKITEDYKVLQPYTYFEKRYLDFPFIDPTTASGQERLQNFYQGKFVNFQDIIILIVAILILEQFNSMAQRLSSSLAEVRDSFNIAEQLRPISKTVYSVLGGDKVEGMVKNSYNVVKGYAQRQLKNVTDGTHERWVKNPLLKKNLTDLQNGKLDMNVVRAVEKKHGYKIGDIDLFAPNTLKQAKMEVLRNAGIAKDKLDKYLKLDTQELKNALAKELYNKDYDKAKQEQQQKIDSFFTSVKGVKVSQDKMKDLVIQNTQEQEKKFFAALKVTNPTINEEKAKEMWSNHLQVVAEKLRRDVKKQGTVQGLTLRINDLKSDAQLANPELVMRNHREIEARGNRNEDVSQAQILIYNAYAAPDPAPDSSNIQSKQGLSVQQKGNYNRTVVSDIDYLKTPDPYKSNESVSFNELNTQARETLKFIEAYTNTQLNKSK